MLVCSTPLSSSVFGEQFTGGFSRAGREVRAAASSTKQWTDEKGREEDEILAELTDFLTVARHRWDEISVGAARRRMR